MDLNLAYSAIRERNQSSQTKTQITPPYYLEDKKDDAVQLSGQSLDWLQAVSRHNQFPGPATGVELGVQLHSFTDRKNKYNHSLLIQHTIPPYLTT